MLVLFDHGAPRGVARALQGHSVITAKARGWDRLTNGVLLKVAEEAAVEVLFTTDQGIGYQQNLMGRKIANVVLAGTTKWSRVRLHLERIAAAVNAAAQKSDVYGKSKIQPSNPVTEGSLPTVPMDTGFCKMDAGVCKHVEPSGVHR